MLRLFTTHPESVDETYLEHARFAAGFSAKLFLAAGAATVHAIFPFLFEKTASRIIAELYHRTHGRGATEPVLAAGQEPSGRKAA